MSIEEKIPRGSKSQEPIEELQDALVLQKRDRHGVCGCFIVVQFILPLGTGNTAGRLGSAS